jgi:hypothetical protein
MPQMELDTKTDRLTDCQSQCDSDSDSLQVWSLIGDIFKLRSSGHAKICGTLVPKLTYYEMSRRISNSDSLACRE